MDRIYSFDVFDTLITRTVASPKDIFLITANRADARWGLKIQPILFAEERVKAEKYFLDQQVHPTIDHIYDRLGKTLGLHNDVSEAIKKLELEIEFEHFKSIEGNVKLLNDFREKGNTIIYVSDMYLPEKVIKNILIKHDIYRPDELIFVSSEYNKSKKSGKLFPHILKILNIDKDQLHHFGNNRSSDIKGAQISGIKATYLESGNLNRYEKLIAGQNDHGYLSTDDLLFYSKVASSARLARLSAHCKDPHIYNVAASVAGPKLYFFTLFVLMKAGDKKIYFLARDGFILYEIAKRIKSKFNLACELIYLNISREVLLLSRLNRESNVDFIANIKKVYKFRKLKDVFSLLSISVDTVSSDRYLSKFIENDLSDIKNDDLHKIFFESDILNQIKSIIDNKRALANRYLAQEGFLSHDPKVLVDVGWELTIHDLMAEICIEHKVPAPDGIYIGINNANSLAAYGNKEAYLWDKRSGMGLEFAMPFKTRIIEAFCSAPVGQTVNYSDVDGTVCPVCNEKDKINLLDWGISDLQNGILNFVDILLDQDIRMKSHIHDRHLSSSLLSLFWMKPSKNEITSWASFPFFTSSNENIIPLQIIYPMRKLLINVFLHGKFPQGKLNSWPHSNFYLLHRYVRKTVLTYLKIRNQLRFSLLR